MKKIIGISIMGALLGAGVFVFIAAIIAVAVIKGVKWKGI